MLRVGLTPPGIIAPPDSRHHRVIDPHLVVWSDRLSVGSDDGDGTSPLGGHDSIRKPAVELQRETKRALREAIIL